MATTQKAVVFKEEEDMDTSQEAMVAAEQHRVDSIDESMFDLQAIRQKEKSFEQGSDDEAVVKTGGRIEGSSNMGMGSYVPGYYGRSYGSDTVFYNAGSYGFFGRSESYANHGGMNCKWFWNKAREKKVHQQNGAQAFLRNSTLMEIRLNKSCNWSGKPSSLQFPKAIAPRAVAQFTHLKGNEFGSKAAVIYTGFNAVNIECAWLLAWDAPAKVTDTTPNKLYVACGLRRHICKMSCDQILAKLENGLPDVISKDKTSKTKVEALIHRQVPNTATIIAMLKLIPFHQ